MRSDTESGVLSAGVARIRAVSPRGWVASASFLIGAAVVTTFFAIGAWQRRWIADDGLIVLRTLRNLFAGNGPVFNAGERVEANTSTAWTYLLWFWAWVTDGQLEYVVLWTALVCAVAAIPIAMYGTARLYRTSIGGLGGDGWTVLLPLGAVIYIAIPPARDFATSGLENGLCLLWVALLWCQLVAWSRRTSSGARSTSATLFLAFWAGLAPLVRPELAVVGGLVLLLIFFAPTTWRVRVGMVVVAGLLPVAYQIFRMGYYALLVPNPAVAKDASGSKWEQGWVYLANLFGPYYLWLPFIGAAVIAIVLLVGARMRRQARLAAVEDSAADDSAHDADGEAATAPAVPWNERLRSPAAVTALMVAAGLICIVYWVRQGGDFMHGRVLLTPIFILLLPLMAVPITVPNLATLRSASSKARLSRTQLAGAVVMFGLWIMTVVWAAQNNSNVLSNAGIDIGRSGIVDERRFYVTNMANQNPVTAQDYLEYPRMQAMVDQIDKIKDEGGVILPSFNYDEWYVAKLPGGLPPEERQVHVYFLNLGMTSMNAPLDVRVIDQMGLAYPLAAHTERLEDGRIGHDKVLPTEWVVAESGAFPRSPILPGYLDEDTVRQAQVALTCPETQARFASFRGDWTFARFKSNLRQAFDFNSYRIEREPLYELQRCGLDVPEPVNSE